MRSDKPDTNELVEALNAAFVSPRPLDSEGWQSMKDLLANCRKETGKPPSEAAIRRRLRLLGERVEKRQFGAYMWYRIHTNGKP